MSGRRHHAGEQQSRKPIACYGPGQVPISFNGAPRAATGAELLAYFAQPRDLRTSPVQYAFKPLLADYDGNGKVLEQRIGDIFPDWTGTFGPISRTGRIGICPASSSGAPDSSCRTSRMRSAIRSTQRSART